MTHCLWSLDLCLCKSVSPQVGPLRVLQVTSTYLSGLCKLLKCLTTQRHKGLILIYIPSLEGDRIGVTFASDIEDEVAPFKVRSMGSLTPYDRINKGTKSQRGSWMPSQRRGKIKKKVVASCLLALAAFCCCKYCYDADEPQENNEIAMTKESFVNVDL